MKTIVAILALGVAALLVGKATAEGERKGPPPAAGKVKATDAKTVKLEGRTKEGKEVAPPQMFDLAKDTKLTEGPTPTPWPT